MDNIAQRQAALRCDLAADVIRNFGELRLKVMGGSMFPAIRPGDVVTLERAESHQLAPGTIVSYRSGDLLITHRVKRVMGLQLIAQGDTVSRRDAPIPSSEILGKVVSIERNGRRVALTRSAWQRIVSGIARRSELSRRVLLRLVLP